MLVIRTLGYQNVWSSEHVHIGMLEIETFSHEVEMELQRKVIAAIVTVYLDQCDCNACSRVLMSLRYHNERTHVIMTSESNTLVIITGDFGTPNACNGDA